jgi:hypothetical protein
MTPKPSPTRKLSAAIPADVANALERERAAAERRAGVPISTSAAIAAALRRAMSAGLLGVTNDEGNAKQSA